MKYYLLIVLLGINFTVFGQNSPFYIYGPGLDGSMTQKAGIYADTQYGLLIEAPLLNGTSKLPIELNWRGGGESPFKIYPTGNVAIGPATGLRKFNVIGTGTVARLESSNNGVYLELANSGGSAYVGSVGSSLLFETGTITRACILANGNMGIGTNAPDEKLSVNGTIHAKEVRIDMQGWPDYVFKAGYQLMPLSELKEYLSKNSRLPGIPGEAEFQQNGTKLGEVVKLQMQKIEELTLYLLEKENQIVEQQKQKDALEQRIAMMEKALANLLKDKK